MSFEDAYIKHCCRASNTRDGMYKERLINKKYKLIETKRITYWYLTWFDQCDLYP